MGTTIVTESISVMSWNATGIMTGIPYLDFELNRNNIDICGLSEHWLREENKTLLDTFSSAYTSHIVVCKDPSTLNSRRIGKGGVGFIWKKKWSDIIEIIDVDDDRITVLKLSLSRENYFFVQVYLPTSCYPYALYSEYVDKLTDLFSMFSNKGQVIFLGDFNASCANDNVNVKQRDAYLRNAVLSINMKILTDSDSCTGPRFSFVPYGSGKCTLIDHIIVQESLCVDVKSCYIVDDSPLNVSRHHPIIMTLKTLHVNHEPIHDSYSRVHYNWKSNSDQCDYKNNVSELLDSTDLVYSDVNRAYDTIVDCITSASETRLSKRAFKPYLKPYWSNELKLLHAQMRRDRHCWKRDGKPRTNSDSYTRYKESKRKFRKLLRQKFMQFEREENERIDNLVEMDQKGFWKVVNSRRKRKRNDNGAEIQFNDKPVKDPDEIADGWCGYFTNLYKFSTDSSFDEEFRKSVDEKINNITSSDTACHSRESSILTGYLSREELNVAIKSLPRNKAPSSDNITYEHIMFGGETLHRCLHELFNNILVSGIIPVKFKQGLIITLHKGAGKPYSNPDNYRAISLLPSIAKLFEKILLTRLENSKVAKSIHPLQHGFQKGKSSKMVTFIVQECAEYCKERGSCLYSCFMDAEKAFDRVWINGLLYKLHQTGLNVHDIQLLSNMFTDMKSRVLYSSLLSKWVPIEQGTRQGSLLSPMFYSVYVNELIVLLCESEAGLKIGNLYFTAPTQADDLLLNSLTRSGLQKLVHICHKYSLKWRFFYKNSKCVVIIYIDRPFRIDRPLSSWSLGEGVILQSTQHKHLGVVQSQSLRHPGDISAVLRTLRGTFLSLVTCGLHPNGINPISAMKLYTSIVLPKALYSCELWNNLTPKTVSELEVAHRFCIKFCQGLPRLTRTDVALGLVGISSIEAYIDMQKLNFLGILCRADSSFIVKYLFLYRLHQYKLQCRVKQKGFVTDIFRIICKYSLDCYLHDFIAHGTFPSKYVWKKRCKTAIWSYEESAWRRRLGAENEFSRFRTIQTELKPAALWLLALKRPDTLELCTYIIRLYSNLSNITLCDSCHALTGDIFFHLCFECTHMDIVKAFAISTKCVRNIRSANLKHILESTRRGKTRFYAWRHKPCCSTDIV